MDPLVVYLRTCIQWCDDIADAEAAAWRKLREQGRRVITTDAETDEEGNVVREWVTDFDTNTVLCSDHGNHDRGGGPRCPNEGPGEDWIHHDHVFDTDEWPPIPEPSADIPAWLVSVIDNSLTELSEHPESIAYIKARLP